MPGRILFTDIANSAYVNQLGSTDETYREMLLQNMCFALHEIDESCALNLPGKYLFRSIRNYFYRDKPVYVPFVLILSFEIHILKSGQVQIDNITIDWDPLEPPPKAPTIGIPQFTTDAYNTTEINEMHIEKRNSVLPISPVRHQLPDNGLREAMLSSVGRAWPLQGEGQGFDGAARGVQTIRVPLHAPSRISSPGHVEHGGTTPVPVGCLEDNREERVRGITVSTAPTDSLELGRFFDVSDFTVPRGQCHSESMDDDIAVYDKLAFKEEDLQAIQKLEESHSRAAFQWRSLCRLKGESSKDCHVRTTGGEVTDRAEDSFVIPKSFNAWDERGALYMKSRISLSAQAVLPASTQNKVKNSLNSNRCEVFVSHYENSEAEDSIDHMSDLSNHFFFISDKWQTCMRRE